MLVEDGYITSVVSGDLDARDVTVIDANELTLMPGMMNTHWHVLSTHEGTDEAIEKYVDEVVTDILGDLLNRGVTTIMGAGDHFPRIIELRRQLADGEIRGPRLLTVGPVFTAPGDWPSQTCDGNLGCEARRTAQLTTPEQARAKVREVAMAGVDAIKIVYDDFRVPEVRIADDVVAAIADEASLYDLVLLAHVTTEEETALKLIDLGVRGFVHPVPFQTVESRDGAALLREMQIPVVTTLSGPSREWREMTGRPFPEAQAERYRLRMEDIEALQNAGVTLAFGTDTSSNQGELAGLRFLAEAQALTNVLSNQEIIASLTRNAAVFLGMGDELGTVESGKIADIILIDGDPLAEISDLMKVQLVIQGGRVVVDNR